MLRIVVLGAAAGGGVPQWNCGCGVCVAARTPGSGLQSTQASIAVSADATHWFLINASPDLRQQLNATRQLHPNPASLRHSPVAGVILTNSEVDAIAGLLSMREGSPFTIYAHARTLAILRANSIFNVLGASNVRRQPIAVDEAFEPALPDSSPSGLQVLPFHVAGKGAWYLEGKAHPAGDDGLGKVGEYVAPTTLLRIRAVGFCQRAGGFILDDQRLLTLDPDLVDQPLPLDGLPHGDDIPVRVFPVLHPRDGKLVLEIFLRFDAAHGVFQFRRELINEEVDGLFIVEVHWLADDVDVLLRSGRGGFERGGGGPRRRRR